MVINQLSHIVPSETPAKGLHSAKSFQRLEQIARLRARGIGNHIPLPQLVVCGDQSAGKSSVLEGLTGIPFPREDGLCTTFATEIILHHQPGDTKVNASIIASKTRTAEQKVKLEQYRVQLSGFDDLPRVIREVSRLTGVRQAGSDTSGPAFVGDVLRIEVQGSLGLHLSVVDLPGLISVSNEQQTDDDVKTVHSLVDEYVADPRTIILAVVQAGNDIANQAIVQKSRKYDLAGERTVGIITKPDLINETTERRIALLAANKDTTKLKLGFFLVKNPTPTEIAKGITPEERYKNETQYFQSSPWKEQNLDPLRTGILALRKYLQVLLDRHIEKELPKVRDEIRSLLHKTDEDLHILGEERSDPSRMRTYLTRHAMSFHRLCEAASNGTYDDNDGAFFTSGRDSRRLRADVQCLNTSFAEEMRCRGAKRRMTTAPGHDHDSEDDEGSTEEVSQTSERVSEKEMKVWIKKMYQYSRGKELPGTYNYVLLAELFREQSSPWRVLANEHIEDVHAALECFVEHALKHIVSDEHVQGELQEVVASHLRANLIAAQNELNKLWEDEKHQPITYNHYFTDNIQKARQQATQQLFKTAMVQTREQDWKGKLHISNTQVDLDRLLNGLQQRVIVNMSDQACSEALSHLNAYYKVALKTWVDNVCRQVIERHLLRQLPRSFSPEAVAAMSEDELARIAQETPELTAQRQNLQTLRENLSISLRELRTGREFK